MTAKFNSKRKSFWNRGLFPRSFEVTIEAPFEDCESRLLNLTQPKSGCLNPTSLGVRTQITADNACNFEIRLNGYGRGGSYTKAKCVGVVFQENGSDKTTVQGRFTLGLLIPISVVFLLLMTPMVLSFPGSEAFFGVIFPIIAVFYGLQTRMEYRWFQSQVYEALRQG